VEVAENYGGLKCLQNEIKELLGEKIGAKAIGLWILPRENNSADIARYQRRAG